MVTVGLRMAHFPTESDTERKEGVFLPPCGVDNVKRIGYANLSNMSENSASVFLILLRMFNGKFFTS